MKKKLLSLTVVALLGASSVMAQQQGGWIEISALRLAATGGTDRSNVQKQYLLISESAAEQHQELLNQMITFTKEDSQMDINQRVPKVQSVANDAIAQMEKLVKEHPEMASEISKAIENAKNQIADDNKYIDPSVKSYTHDPAPLLRQLTAIAINRKPYTGYFDMGNGLWAVTESPRYGPLQDDAFIKVKPENPYSWGAIDQQGKTVIPQKYLMLNDYFDRPEENLVVMAEKGEDGNDRYGAYGYDGRIRIPFVYDNITIIDSREHLIVAIKNGKYGSIDFDGKILWPFEYVKCEMCGIGWPVSRDGKTYGVVSHQGKEVIPFKYKGYWSASNYQLRMERFDGKLDVYDENFNFLSTEAKPHE